MLANLLFLEPWLFGLLLILPVLWWLLRIMPPAPRKVPFPAISLLLGLKPKEESAFRSPWWLLLLRLFLAALVIAAFAHPVWQARIAELSRGSELILVENDWAAARQWNAHVALAREVIEAADRTGRPVALVPLAESGSRNAPAITFGPARAALVALGQIQPQPWLSNRGNFIDRLRMSKFPASLHTTWLTNGLAQGEVDRKLQDALKGLGGLSLYRDAPGGESAMILANNSDSRTVTIGRSNATFAQTVHLVGYDASGHPIMAADIAFATGASRQSKTLDIPFELSTRLHHLVIEGEHHAGAIFLAGEHGGERALGFLSVNPEADRQPFLGPLYFLDRALEGRGEIHAGPVDTLLSQPLSLIFLPDSATLTEGDRSSLRAWVEKGGTLVRFAGEHLAEQSDDLLPVPIRPGVRETGGDLSWTKNLAIAAFREGSPFAGLAVPEDVHIKRQIVAEPEADLGAKSWVTLNDGTPLVTAAKQGKGQLILFHTNATAQWSDLVLSGAFVQMLERLVQSAAGIETQVTNAPRLVNAVSILDGYGTLNPAGETVPPVTPALLTSGPPGPEAQPGLYGEPGRLAALNASTGMREPPKALALSGLQTITRQASIDLKPWLLLAAFALFLFDLALSIGLRGLLQAGALGTILFTGLFMAPIASAQLLDPTAMAQVMHLAYVRTGATEVDQISRAGLTGLTGVLVQRTSVDIGDPVAIDPDTDDLSFYPLLYWPVSGAQRTLSPQAIARLNAYLASGGLIFFDTADRPLSNLAPGEGGPGMARLQEMVRGLDIPPLVPIPADHVLGRSFYLLRDFPGRWAGGSLWVEPHNNGRLNDGVSSVLIGSNDYASAWAIDEFGRPLFPVTPGGETQREYAYRFGVNLVMYVLTGNYKTDQVHVPAILQRLGQ
ncbi:MAG TPA: DUF4159 domain-containing protein [Dongiaceae bacterium]|jgi:hypothetical protein|nr:DUF4159 domain-containing protein [Dongiaceae bacterium]